MFLRTGLEYPPQQPGIATREGERSNCARTLNCYTTGGFDPTTRLADFAALKSTLFDAAQEERFPRCLPRSQQGEVCSPEQFSWNAIVSSANSEASLGLNASGIPVCFVISMASIHLYFAGKQVGDTQKRGKPEMRSSCRKSLIGVGPARLRPCKCPPPQIPVSQSPF